MARMIQDRQWPAGLGYLGLHLARGDRSGSVASDELGLHADARILHPWEAGEDRSERDGTVMVEVNGEWVLLARLDAIAGGAGVNLTVLAALMDVPGPYAALRRVLNWMGGSFSETHVTLRGVTHAHQAGTVVSLRDVSFLSESSLGDVRAPDEVPDVWLNVAALLSLPDVPPARQVQVGARVAVTDGVTVALDRREWSVADLRALIAQLD